MIQATTAKKKDKNTRTCFKLPESRPRLKTRAVECHINSFTPKLKSDTSNYRRILSIVATLLCFVKHTMPFLASEKKSPFTDVASSVSSNAKNTSTQSSFSCVDSLVQDMLSLLKDEKTSDVVFEAGDETIRAHKTVLQARSAYFRNFFASDAYKGRICTIQVERISGATFRKVLRYFYSNSAGEMTAKEAIEVLYLADMYQMKELKNICQQRIIPELSGKNALSLLTHAKKTNADNLKKCTLECILRNHEEFRESISSLNGNEDGEVFKEVLVYCMTKGRFVPSSFGSTACAQPNKPFGASTSQAAPDTSSTFGFFGAPATSFENPAPLFGASDPARETCGGFFGSTAGASKPTQNGGGFFGSTAGGSKPTQKGGGFFGSTAGGSEASQNGGGFFGSTAGGSQPTQNGGGLFGSTAGISEAYAFF